MFLTCVIGGLIQGWSEETGFTRAVAVVKRRLAGYYDR